MRATGIVRRLDNIGRLVLPIELRRTLGLEQGDALEIFIEGNSVMLRRYEPLCVFCGSGGHLTRITESRSATTAELSSGRQRPCKAGAAGMTRYDRV